jgi:beta/gamma crystallin
MADRFHHLILFDDSRFGGSHKHVFRSIDYLDDFNDLVSSFAVLSGTWQHFRDSQFQGANGSVFAPRVGGYAWVKDYDVDNDSISSVRLTGEEARQVPHALLFAEPNFGGAHKHVFDAFVASGRWRHSKSIAILAGTWRFDLVGGSSVTLVPGIYADASTQFIAPIAAVEVVNVATPDPGIAHLILFDDAGFKGGHRHVFGDQTELGDWDGRVSAIAVEHGAWQIFTAKNFNSPEGPPLTRGIYPYVEDFDIENDRAASVRQVVMMGSPPLVSIANMNDGQNMLTAHGDRYRLGWNAHETQLTLANVRVPDFGLLWRRDDLLGQDGKPARVYGQPLYVSAALSGLGRDLVLIATASNDVFALDASNQGATVWQAHLGLVNNALDDDHFDAGLKGGPCRNTSPLHGVNGTPLILRHGARPILYVCFLAKIDPAGGHGDPSNDWNQAYFLQALDVATGQPFPPFAEPIRLAGSYLHPNGKMVRFRPYMHTQRGALTFVDSSLGDGPRGWVLATFSSRCDLFGKAKDEDWQGWVIGVQASGRPPEPLLFSTSTNEFGENKGCGGIWGTAGIAVDDLQRMYTVSGNGKFDGVENFANTVVKLANLRAVADSYTARDWQWMRDKDRDLGSCSAVLLPPMPLLQEVPDAAAGKVNLVVTGGKDGRVYLLNADALGGVGGAFWRQRIFSDDSYPYYGGIAITPAFYDAGARGKFLYYCSASDSPHRGMIAIQFDHLEGEGHFGVRAIQFEGPRFTGAPGAPFVSSNGAADGIVWAVDSFRQQSDEGENSILRAWDAVTGELLYSSPATAAQKLGNGRKFSSIAVLHGKVLVGAASIACYGLKREDL